MPLYSLSSSILHQEERKQTFKTFASGYRIKRCQKLCGGEHFVNENINHCMKTGDYLVQITSDFVMKSVSKLRSHDKI